MKVRSSAALAAALRTGGLGQRTNPAVGVSGYIVSGLVGLR
jgi:hypothetical protein